MFQIYFNLQCVDFYDFLNIDNLYVPFRCWEQAARSDAGSFY